MLHLEQTLIARIIDQVPDFAIVGNPSLLIGMQDIGPQLPACIVVPGAGNPSANSTMQLPFSEEQDWTVSVIVGHQYSDSVDGLTEQLAGQLMTDTVKALHHWKPTSGSAQHQPFRYTGRAAPSYNAGYAEFPLSFNVKAIVCAP